MDAAAHDSKNLSAKVRKEADDLASDFDEWAYALENETETDDEEVEE